jgi:hypothetical protein
LAEAGYSLQANRKTCEGPSHPDRDTQFRYINQQVRRFQRGDQPVISVDTKKKELVGDFKNAGRDWRPKGPPTLVRAHDFLIPARGKATRGKAIPSGVYDLTRNAGGWGWGSITTWRPSLCGRSGAGGAGWASRATDAPARC